MSTKRYELDRDRGFLEQPAELARGTLQWSSLTDLNVVVIDDNFSTHALVDQDGRRVRVVQRGRRLDSEANARPPDRGGMTSVVPRRPRG